MKREAAEALDRSDPLAHVRQRFVLPADSIYLDGNSLGALPTSVPSRIREAVVNAWGQQAIRSWNADWLEAPRRVSARIAPLLGAAAHEVQVADSTSVNLFKLLAASTRLRPGRGRILVDSASFPTNLYLVDSVASWSRAALRVERMAVAQFERELDEDVAVVVLSHVDFRTGALYPLAALTRAAHRVGACVLVDLSHSTGTLPLSLHDWGVDLAVGCGYKFLCGGPGAPAYAFVHEAHHARLEHPLTGWFGHAHPFRFEPEFAPAGGIERLQCGTPPILSLLALEAALDVFDGVDLTQVRRKAVEQGELMVQRVHERCRRHSIELASPADPLQRGSQVSFRHPRAYPIMQALIERGVIGDFRAPDVLRFGIAPLYTRYVDLWDAVHQLEQILATHAWKAFPEQPTQTVT